jgi:hypothetical protein
VKGVDNMLLGGTVFFIDTFSCMVAEVDLTVQYEAP